LEWLSLDGWICLACRGRDLWLFTIWSVVSVWLRGGGVGGSVLVWEGCDVNGTPLTLQTLAKVFMYNNLDGDSYTN
jgi:hypothetical protein